MTTCERCGKEDHEIVMWICIRTSYTGASPRIHTVCGSCLTDWSRERDE
jgi:hypothetical protein